MGVYLNVTLKQERIVSLTCHKEITKNSRTEIYWGPTKDSQCYYAEKFFC